MPKREKRQIVSPLKISAHGGKQPSHRPKGRKHWSLWGSEPSQEAYQGVPGPSQGGKGQRLNGDRAGAGLNHGIRGIHGWRTCEDAGRSFGPLISQMNADGILPQEQTEETEGEGFLTANGRECTRIGSGGTEMTKSWGNKIMGPEIWQKYAFPCGLRWIWINFRMAVAASPAGPYNPRWFCRAVGRSRRGHHHEAHTAPGTSGYGRAAALGRTIRNCHQCGRIHDSRLTPF